MLLLNALLRKNSGNPVFSPMSSCATSCSQIRRGCSGRIALVRSSTSPVSIISLKLFVIQQWWWSGRAMDEVRFLLQIEFLDTGAFQIVTYGERIAPLNRMQVRSQDPVESFPKANAPLTHARLQTLG
jgi:hypothetical protein